MNAPARFDPAFVTIADTDCDVSHGGETYRAYFTLGPNADAPFLLGAIRYGDEVPLDRELTAWLLGLATVLRWEGECPAWGDDDWAAQAGYDAAREARV
jgi:hypothetical protein